MAETETTVTEEKPENEAKGLRAQNDQLRKENRELKAEKRDDIITDLGLTVDSGLGMALVEQFDAGNLPLADIKQVATEKYGHVVPDAQPAAHPQAQAITQAQAGLDNLGQQAGSVRPPTADEDLARAEADKDFNKTLAAKSAQLGEMLRP